MEWVASTLHTTSEHGASSITTADAHTSAASKLNWRPSLKWTRPFRRKTKSGFCACAITFQTHSTQRLSVSFASRSFVYDWATLAPCKKSFKNQLGWAHRILKQFPHHTHLTTTPVMCGTRPTHVGKHNWPAAHSDMENWDTWSS